MLDNEKAAAPTTAIESRYLEIIANITNALNGPFKEFKKYKQFIVYKLEESSNGKTKKIPVNHISGHNCDCQDAKNQLEATIAIQAATDLIKKFNKPYYVGFVFTDKDPFFFLDIDNCYNKETKQWSEISAEACKIFTTAALEVSSSEKGIHIFGVYNGQLNHRCKNNDLGIELYTEGRFVALTGLHARGNVDVDCTDRLKNYIEKYLPSNGKKTNPDKKDCLWNAKPVISWDGFTNDDELIQYGLRLKSPKNIWGNKAAFSDLWEANDEKLSISFPSNDNRPYDCSSADAALAQHLAFLTGNNHQRIHDLMFKSNLVRDKWHDREDYLIRTITNACQLQSTWFNKNFYKQSHINHESTPLISDLEWSEVSISDIHSNPSPPPSFYIEDLLPEGLLTLLAAHGGTGKSTLGLQAAAHLATGISFMGKNVTKCRVLFVSAEDTLGIIRNRLAKICNYLKLDPRELTQSLKIIDSTKNPCLYEENSSRPKGETTQGYFVLSEIISEFNAEVVIIDNHSDVYDANENVRPQMRSFLRSLIQLKKDSNIAILLLDHVNKQTAKREETKEAYSGSTAKHNSARSRLYLESNDDVLTLRHEKSNHGKRSDDIQMVWMDGVLIHKSDATLALHNALVDEENIKIVLSLIDERYKRGDDISPLRKSRPNPYKALKDNLNFPKSIKNVDQLIRLLDLAESRGLLTRETYRTEQKNQKTRYKVIEFTEKT